MTQRFQDFNDFEFTFSLVLLRRCLSWTTIAASWSTLWTLRDADAGAGGVDDADTDADTDTGVVPLVEGNS